MQEVKLYINGKWVENHGGKVIDDVSPADGSVVAKVHTAGAEDVEAAIAAAQAAWPAWSKLLPADRELYLLKAADHLEKNAEKYAGWLMDEGGSGFIKAIDEVGQSVSIWRAAAGECRRINGGIIPVDTLDQLSTYIRCPLGVVAGIAPFNYPLLLALGKAALAMAAGNAFVLKPSSDTPLSGVIIAECCEAAGIPDGVFNLIPGPGNVVGDAFTSDKRVRMVTFTGSTKVGSQIACGCAAHGKKYTLEMGGKNPLIVLADYDVDQAVSVGIFGAYFHQGQICMGTNRIIVEEPIYDEFCAKFLERVKALKTGNLRDPAAVIGPLIKESQCAVLDGHIADAVAKGARLLCGGTHEGAWYAPSVLADVNNTMNVFYEESFGPLASIIKAKDAEDALTIANDSDYGLSSALLTNNLSLALDMAPRIEAGMVHVNDSTVMGSRQAPFGGIKASGYGREGSSFSIEEFTELKWITYQVKPHGYPTD
ncbi:MAG: aldehyde dehydrogenase family protein [Oscillospiraceae bacterium]|nr:aldehyde dehydrogenase family protein [Oscillospiraceae bacterium]